MHPLSFRRALRTAIGSCAAAFALTVPAADLPWPGSAPPAAPAAAPTRGALLYETHCIECHTAQVHWRDRRQARDWATLKAEVLRWQAAAGLGWTDAEVEDVTQHLNDTVYRFAAPQEQARRGPAPAQ